MDGMQDKKKDGGPAFPGRQNTGKFGEFRSHSEGPGVSFPITEDMPGMTLRDYFAGQALAGLCANSAIDIEISEEGRDGINAAYAKEAYQVADAMLAERDK